MNDYKELVEYFDEGIRFGKERLYNLPEFTDTILGLAEHNSMLDNVVDAIKDIQSIRSGYTGLYKLHTPFLNEGEVETLTHKLDILLTLLGSVEEGLIKVSFGLIGQTVSRLEKEKEKKNENLY